MAVGPWSPIEAVAIRHEKGAVASWLCTALRPVTIPAGTRPTEPQRARSLRLNRISIIQNGGLSLSISASLDAAEKTFKLLPFLSGGRRRTIGLLLMVWMDRRLVQMEGMC